MGGLMSVQVPVPDERMLEMIAKLKLKDKDLRVLYQRFSKCDKEVRALDYMASPAVLIDCATASHSGTIDRSEFYAAIDEKSSEFGDAIFALIDEDNSGQLDFSEYVEALGKFCVLSKEDMLKFCFNVFDADRNGTIEGTELTHLLDILHEDQPTSNMKMALKSFDFNGDGKLDFAEFTQLNGQFPGLLYPAFRIQQNMRIYTMGEAWWRRKIEELHAAHAAQLARAAQSTGENLDLAQQEAFKKQKRQEQAIRIRMGCMQYYCCPCRRQKYVINETAPADDEDSGEDDDEQERQKKKAKKKDKATVKPVANKRQNIVKVPRKPLTQEERMERARKRRMRDMQDRPARKD